MDVLESGGRGGARGAGEPGSRGAGEPGRRWVGVLMVGPRNRIQTNSDPEFQGQKVFYFSKSFSVRALAFDLSDLSSLLALMIMVLTVSAPHTV